MTVTTTTELREKVLAGVKKSIAEERAAYERECKEYAEQGFRAHYCRHGVNLWVDYDPICGYCEESLTEAEEAAYRTDALLDERKRRGDQGVRLAVVVSEILNRSVSDPLEAALRTAVTEVMDWVNEPLKPYLNEEG